MKKTDREVVIEKEKRILERLKEQGFPGKITIKF